MSADPTAAVAARLRDVVAELDAILTVLTSAEADAWPAGAGCELEQVPAMQGTEAALRAVSAVLVGPAVTEAAASRAWSLLGSSWEGRGLRDALALVLDAAVRGLDLGATGAHDVEAVAAIRGGRAVG